MRTVKGTKSQDIAAKVIWMRIEIVLINVSK